MVLIKMEDTISPMNQPLNISQRRIQTIITMEDMSQKILFFILKVILVKPRNTYLVQVFIQQ